MNEVIHLYHYADYDEREAVRWRMSRDSEWGGFDIETRPMIKSHRSEIFLPATKALSAAGVDDALERLKKMADVSASEPETLGCTNCERTNSSSGTTRSRSSSTRWRRVAQ